MSDFAEDTNVSTNDCISRQAAMDAAIEAVDSWDGMTSIGRQKRIEKYINALPSAEPKRGRWIRNDNGTYSCSVCQSWIPEEQHCYARYCLYCGAKMEVNE